MVKISVIMPVFNEERFVGLAIKSILNQTESSFEFIIIDDGSSDKTVTMINGFGDRRIRLIKNHQHQGLTKCLNQGLKMAKGKFISRMDADDVSLPTRLREQVNFLEKNRDYGLCGTWVNLINEKGEIIGRRKYPSESKEISKVILRYNPVVHPTLMVRREVLQTLGFYDESLDGAEDYDLVLRIGQKYKMANIPKRLLNYRIRPQAVSLSAMKRVELQAIKARLRALRFYYYPKWQYFYLIKPLFFFLIPENFKRWWIIRT